MLESLPAESFLVDIIFWLTVALIVFSLLLFATVILLHLRNAWLKYRTKVFRRKWRPLLFQWMAGEITRLPSLHRRESIMMLDLWYKIRQHIDDSSAERLNDFALELDLDEVVTRILQYRDSGAENRKVWLQIQAIRVAQALNTPVTRTALLRAADTANLLVNVEATCALVEINHENAELEVLSTLLRFHQWAPYIALKISKAGGAETLHLAGRQLDQLEDEQIRNLISLIELSDDKSLLPFLTLRLEHTTDLDEQAALLRTVARLGGPSCKDQVLPYLKHPNAVLRTTAATALGNTGSGDDYQLLVPLLGDPDWWVRYRSAQALLKLRPMTENTLTGFLETQTDPFARDILRQAYAENML